MKQVMSIQNRVRNSGLPACHEVPMTEDDHDDS
jgi:hypothetical protein